MSRKERNVSPRAWLRLNRVDLAPLTGSDARALDAIAACWDLYAITRDARVLASIGLLLETMQPSTRDLTRLLIARSLDWCDVDPLWLLVRVDGNGSAPWSDALVRGALARGDAFEVKP